MKTTNIFMTCHWENLIISTFEVDKTILEKYLPTDTKLDLYNGKALMSMVAFTFSKVKFFGLKIPFHQKFGQINFRFYAKSKINGSKGVVFIKEFAPKPLITSIGNLIYNEPYFYKNIKQKTRQKNNKLNATYTYKNIEIEATATNTTKELEEESLNHFVVDRYIAFVKSSSQETFQYKINHVPWELYSTHSISVKNDILTLLPKKFKDAKQISTCFVNGSYVTVEKGILQKELNLMTI